MAREKPDPMLIAGRFDRISKTRSTLNLDLQRMSMEVDRFSMSQDTSAQLFSRS